MSEPTYVIEVVREIDQSIYMLMGHYSEDQDDSWYFNNRGSMRGDESHWAKLKSICAKFGSHEDFQQWLVDFVIPDLRKLEERQPVGAEYHPYERSPWQLTIYQVNEKASLNLRFKPILCRTLYLTGEPFVGAIKQGYHSE